MMPLDRSTCSSKCPSQAHTVHWHQRRSLLPSMWGFGTQVFRDHQVQILWQSAAFDREPISQELQRHQSEAMGPTGKDYQVQHKKDCE